MPPDQSDRFVELRQQWQRGDEKALKALQPQVYKEMRHLAHHHHRITPCETLLWFTKLTFDYLEASRWSCRTGFVAVGSRLTRQMQGPA